MKLNETNECCSPRDPLADECRQKLDLPQESSGGAGLMDGEDFSGAGGPRPNGDGAGVVAAPHDGPRPSNVRVHGQRTSPGLCSAHGGVAGHEQRDV